MFKYLNCLLLYLFFMCYQTIASDLIKFGSKSIRYRQAWYYISRALDKINRDDDNHNLYKWYGLIVGLKLDKSLKEVISSSGIYDVSVYYKDGSGHAMLLVADPLNKRCLFIEPNVGIYIFNTDEEGIDGIKAFLKPDLYSGLFKAIKYLRLFLPQDCNLCSAYIAQLAYIFLKNPTLNWQELSPKNLGLEDFDPFPKFLLKAKNLIEQGDEEAAFWLLSKAFFLLPEHIQSRFNEIKRLKQNIETLNFKKQNIREYLSSRGRGRGSKMRPNLDQQIQDSQEILDEKIEELSISNAVEDQIYYLRHKIALRLGKDDLFDMTTMHDFLMTYSNSDINNICDFFIRKVTII